MKERYKSIGPVTKYNPHKYTSQVDQTVEKLAEVVTEAPVPNTDLRGSLASTMSIDLTEEPTQTTRTITRI